MAALVGSVSVMSQLGQSRHRTVAVKKEAARANFNGAAQQGLALAHNLRVPLADRLVAGMASSLAVRVIVRSSKIGRSLNPPGRST